MGRTSADTTAAFLVACSLAFGCGGTGGATSPSAGKRVRSPGGEAGSNAGGGADGAGADDRASVAGAAGVRGGDVTPVRDELPDGEAPCPGWQEDVTFQDLVLPAGYALHGLAPVWARSEEDMYVAAKVVAAGDSSGSHVAMLHGDGLGWHAELLPPRCEMLLAMSGPPEGSPWLLCSSRDKSAPVIITKNAADGSWADSELGFPIGFDLAVLAANDALLAVSPTRTKGQGVVARFAGPQGGWVPMPLPDTGVPYTVVSIVARDVSHVGGIAVSEPSSGVEAYDTILSFDGTAWTALRLPTNTESPEAAPAIRQLLAVTPSGDGTLYVLAEPMTASQGDALYHVSADLTSWTELTTTSSHGSRAFGQTAQGVTVLLQSPLRETSPLGAARTLLPLLFAYSDDTTATCVGIVPTVPPAGIVIPPPSDRAGSIAARGALVHLWTTEDGKHTKVGARHFYAPVP